MLLRSLILNCGLSVFTAAVREGEGDTGGTGGTPPVVVAPWGADVSKPWMVGDAASAKPWYEAMLPDGPTKELVRSKNYGNPVQMADALFSANRMANGNAVEIPNIGEPNTPFDPKPWEGLNAKMRGESIKAPGDYKFNFGKDAEGKDIAGDPAMVDFAQKLAFDLGVHPKRAQEQIVNRWQEFARTVNEKSVADANAQNEADANGVRQKWGANFETLRAGGERAMRALGLEPATLTALEAHIGAAPLLDIFAKLGQMSAEGKMIGGAGSGTTDPVNMTADQVQAQIDAKRNDPQVVAALNDKAHPRHAAVLAEMEALYKLQAAKKPA